MKRKRLEINNGLLSSRTIQNRHNGDVFNVADLLDTPCGLLLICLDSAGAVVRIPWCMRGNYDALEVQK